MYPAYFYLVVDSIYDYIAIIVSILIIFHFSLSFYYGAKMIIMKSNNKFGWCPEMMVTYQSFLWILLFSYILIRSFGHSKLIDNTSFGAVFIRPMILITSVITCVLQKRRYIKYKSSLKMYKEIEEKIIERKKNNE